MTPSSPYDIGAIIAAANPPVRDEEPPKDFLARMLALGPGDRALWELYDRATQGFADPVYQWTGDEAADQQHPARWDAGDEHADALAEISLTRYDNAWVVGWRGLQHAETTLTGAWRVRTAIMRDYASYMAACALGEPDRRQARRLGLADTSVSVVRSHGAQPL